jgi:hypothetical protein
MAGDGMPIGGAEGTLINAPFDWWINTRSPAEKPIAEPTVIVVAPAAALLASVVYVLTTVVIPALTVSGPLRPVPTP